MTTVILHSDVIGTSYQHSRFDVQRMKAVRKFIISSTRTSIEAVSENQFGTSIIKDLTTATGSAGSYVTPLGPLWVDPGEKTQLTDWEIVHPENNALPLQTIVVQKMGDQRYLVTCQYFVIAGSAGGGAGVSEVAQFRASLYSKKTYFRSDSLDGESEKCLVPGAIEDTGVDGLIVADLPAPPESYARTEVLPEVKIQLPFALLDSPVDSTLVSKVGGVNNVQVIIGGNTFAPGEVRFDGVQLNQFGSTTSSAGQTFNVKGFYEFTARGDKFQSSMFFPGGTNSYTSQIVYEGIVATDYASWTLSDIGLA
tara:strand:- start:5094 stop:6023 length:930 start_codon:yes stop_codon:yes gene_type:complete